MKNKKEKKITRKDAFRKMGMIALSAATMILLLNKPGKAQDDPGSTELPPDW